MVRPFFRWMVSACAPGTASSPTKKRCPIKRRMMTRSLIQAHSSKWEGPTNVTKVPFQALVLRIVVTACLAPSGLQMVHAAENPPERPAEALYLRLGEVGLDPTRVYQVREASLDRSAIHITLEDGTIGFTQDVMGRITGAFFEGYGEVLLTPPNEVERRSMSLFTGMAILEEHFSTAYFRFNDDAAKELGPDLRAAENKQEFVQRWGGTARNLASGDATRLLITFSRMLPLKGNTNSSEKEAVSPENAADRFLHARLQGTKLGIFDVYFDSGVAEQTQIGQAKSAENGDLYYDVWTSFSPGDAGTFKGRREPAPEGRKTREGRIEVRPDTTASEGQTRTQ